MSLKHAMKEFLQAEMAALKPVAELGVLKRSIDEKKRSGLIEKKVELEFMAGGLWKRKTKVRVGKENVRKREKEVKRNFSVENEGEMGKTGGARNG